MSQAETGERGAWTRWRPEGQLALFELAHEHVFERWRGPHLEFPPQVIRQPANPELWRYKATEDRWCIGCHEWVRFVEGSEVPKGPKGSR